jgi:hypothetical protein
MINLVSKYHKNVQKGIILFGKQCSKFRKISGKPIPIIHPTKRKMPILYRPDVHFITRFNKIYVFEILDSELKDENLIISDIIQAFLTLNISKVFFIVPTEADQDKVLNLTIVIAARLGELGIPKKNFPIVTVFYILKNEAKTPETVETLIRRNYKMRNKIIL